jgi:hypothetical protein
MSIHTIRIAANAVAISAGLCFSVSATPSTDDLKPIIVTATPLSEDPDFLATIVDSVNRDQILRSGGANLADALADVPGVTGSSFAAGASRPVIRGFDSNRVRTLEDGIGSFDVSDVGPDHGVPIDPLAADRIEVVRGAATLRYGSQAIGGVVHYDATYGIPSDTTYIDMRQTKEMLRSSFAIDWGALQTLTLEGGYGDYQHRERDPDGTVASTFGTLKARMIADFVRARLSDGAGNVPRIPRLSHRRGIELAARSDRWRILAPVRRGAH